MTLNGESKSTAIISYYIQNTFPLYFWLEGSFTDFLYQFKNTTICLLWNLCSYTSLSLLLIFHQTSGILHISLLCLLNEIVKSHMINLSYFPFWSHYILPYFCLTVSVDANYIYPPIFKVLEFYNTPTKTILYRNKLHCHSSENQTRKWVLLEVSVE